MKFVGHLKKESDLFPLYSLRETVLPNGFCTTAFGRSKMDGNMTHTVMRQASDFHSL